MIYTAKQLRDARRPLLNRLERMGEVAEEERLKKDKKKKPKKTFTKINLFHQRWLLR